MYDLITLYHIPNAHDRIIEDAGTRSDTAKSEESVEESRMSWHRRLLDPKG